MTSYLHKPKNRRMCRTYVVSDHFLFFFLFVLVGGGGGGGFKILKFIFFGGGGRDQKNKYVLGMKSL